MSEQPFYLRDNYAPIEHEVSSENLAVVGAIPEELNGLFLRNGPNPWGRDPGHWFMGDGMIHGLRLGGGRADWYRNRYVQTPNHRGEEIPMVTDEGKVNLATGPANTHVVGHAGKVLALVEVGFPMEMDRELNTVGYHDYGGKLNAAFTAHPKFCPITGEMLAFGYGFFPPYLTYHRVSAEGELVQSEAIDVPGGTMMHDFAITENHTIFMDLSVVFTPELVAKGMPYCWDESYGARLGVMPRAGGNADVTWIEIDPCFVFHPMNAHERDGLVVMDVARFPRFMEAGGSESEPATLTRWTIDVANKVVKEEQLDDRPIEFPRVDPRREGLLNRFGYSVQLAEGPLSFKSLLKYDLDTMACEVHDFGGDTAVSEGVFVPAGPDAAEDEGYVMAFVYDIATDASEYVILNAQDFAGEPVARIALPQRVPNGFHGSWLPDPA
jgi:carotenoid cleavage dioxygenase-like enzyme